MTETSERNYVREMPYTGHRPGRDPEDPRNSTVCFVVSEHEKAMIDALGYCTNLRRSAILTRIVTTFLEGAMAGERYEEARKQLMAFLKECREAVEKRPEWIKQMPFAELERRKKRRE